MPRAHRLRFTVLVLAATGLLAGTDVAKGSSSAREGSLVFARPGGLHVLDLGTRRIARLTVAAGPADREPAVSPDGRLLAFERAAPGAPRILIRDLVSGQTSEIGAGRSPAFGPSGRELAFATAQGIAVADIATLQQRLVTDRRTDDHPAWSALGDIAFTRDEPRGRAVYSVRPDGTPPARIAWVNTARALPERPDWGRGQILLVQVRPLPTCPLPRTGMLAAPGFDVAVSSCARQAVWAPGAQAFAELYPHGLAIVSTRGRRLAGLCHLKAVSRGGLAWSDSPVLAAIAAQGSRRSLGCAAPRRRRPAPRIGPRRRDAAAEAPRRRGGPVRHATSHSVVCWRTKGGKRRCVRY